MSTADWIIVGSLLLSVLLAAANGFFFELFSLAGVVIGYMVAAWGYQTVAAWYLPMAKSPWVADIAGFLTIFLGVVLLAGMLARLTRWAMKESGLGWADRLLGAAFGAVRGVLLIAVVLLAAAAFAPRAGWLSQSRTAPYILVVARAAIWVAPAGVRARFHEGIAALRDMRVRQDKSASTAPGAQALPDNPEQSGSRNRTPAHEKQGR